jgi:hypothetical protein
VTPDIVKASLELLLKDFDDGPGGLDGSKIGCDQQAIARR